jgi:hypothetical protein
VALGRKNYLFAGSDARGERAAAMYSMIGSAKLTASTPKPICDNCWSAFADHLVNCIEESMPRSLKAAAPILPRLIRIQESMQRVPADSSSIASIGYAPEQQVLELEFRQSGEVYQYFNVPAEEHTAFLAADSKGTYLNRRFKPRQYRYHRVRPQQE